MKIQTDRRGWFSQTVGLGNHKVEFNGAGVAEVSDKIGSEVLEKYNTMVYPAGKLPQKDKPVQPQVNEGEAKELLGQIERLQSQNSEQKEQYENKIEILENEVKGWKDEFEKAKSESGEIVKQAISGKEFEALAGLIDQNVNDLKQFATDKLGLEQANVEPLRKPQLIVEIFKTILNADNA